MYKQGWEQIDIQVLTVAPVVNSVVSDDLVTFPVRWVKIDRGVMLAVQV